MSGFDAYIICATPRSGSTLLCDLLTETGIAGRPDSFFRRESFAWWADYLHVPNDDWKAQQSFDLNYLAAVRDWGSNGTPVFGMRLMWESVGDLSDRLGRFYPGLRDDNDRFEAAFGKLEYLHLTREDKIAQAVSRYKAEHSGLWHRYADGSERERLKPGREPVYDARALAEIVATLEEHDARWTAWFRRQEIQPIPVNYEELAADPRQTLATILSALGLDGSIAWRIEPISAKMADSTSLAWAERFRKEQQAI